MNKKNFPVLNAQTMFNSQTNNSYNRLIGPNNYFWKYIVRKESGSIPAFVPDTVTSGDSDFPSTWIYTGKDGLLHATQQFTPRDIQNKFCAAADPDQLVAVIKKPQYLRLDVQLATTKKVQHILSQTMQNNQENIIIQRFVKSCGTRASICRTLYKAESHSEAWVISNKREYYSSQRKWKEDKEDKQIQFLTTSAFLDRVNVVHTTRGQPIQKTVPVLAAIRKWLRDHYGLQVLEMAADFIRDQSGVMWMAGVKHFLLKEPLLPGILFKSAPPKQIYKKTRGCGYCQKVYFEAELNFRMTLKMIIELDRLIERRGKTFGWLNRSKGEHLEKESLYEQAVVCERCYQLYRCSRDLRDLQLEFAAKLGLPAASDSKPISLGNCKPEFKHEELPTKSEALERKQTQKQVRVPALRTTMCRFRMLLFFQSIRQVCSIDVSKQYFLQYALFNQRVRYRLQVNQSSKELLLNRLRLFYIFAPSQRVLAQYFQQLKFLRLTVQTEDSFRRRQAFASLDIELTDFQKVHMRELYKMFNLKNTAWGWGLSASIGLVPGGETQTSGLNLVQNFGIYLPPQDYFACEPLPPDWETMIGNYKPAKGLQSQYQLNLQSKQSKRSTSLRQLGRHTQFPCLMGKRNKLG